MVVASLELIRAREAAGQLLEELGLEAYLFEVEPGTEVWTLRVECAAPDGWRVGAISVSQTDLMESEGDPAVFSRLLDGCRARFSGCSTRAPA